MIVFVWVNDENSKRAYDRKTDAYRVFQKMLKSGHPPDDWHDLLKEAKGETNRLAAIYQENFEESGNHSVVEETGFLCRCWWGAETGFLCRCWWG